MTSVMRRYILIILNNIKFCFWDSESNIDKIPLAREAYNHRWKILIAKLARCLALTSRVAKNLYAMVRRPNNVIEINWSVGG